MEVFFTKFSNLYHHINYTCPANSIVNRIIEYDIKGAGYNISKKYRLIDDKKIELLKEMKSRDRDIYIGKMQITDERLRKKLPEYMRLERMNFFRLNHIQDEHVLSIKNDAIFIVGIKCKRVEFENIRFVEKNIYSSYHNINGIELFYRNREDKLDIKGINDKIVEEHEEGMVKFLKECFQLIEMGKMAQLKKHLIKFSNKYKSRKLPPIYYKEFNHTNQYSFNSDDITLYVEDLPKDMIDDLNITYNYLFFILPLLNRYLFD